MYWRTRKAVVFPLALLTASFALGCFCLYSHLCVEPPRVLDGKDETVEGTVCELPYRQYGRWYYVVQVDSVADRGAPQRFKIRLSAQNALPGAGPYSRVRAKIHLFAPSGGDGYSSRSYYASKGIFMFAFLYRNGGEQVLPPAGRLPLYGYALKLRQSLIRSVDEMLPSDEAALVNGVFLGDTSSLSADLTADFRTDGISHILSVSGLHMATIAELLIFFLLFLHIPRKPAAVIAGCGVLGFMAATCFVPSVMRSGIMCLLCLAAPLLSRRADPLNSLCAAVLLICLVNPYAAADVGLLLSFFATLGLILCANPMAKRLNAKLDRVYALRPLVRGIDGVLATSAAATLFTLPIILLDFGTVSVIAPLSNLLELVPSSLMIGFGAAAAVLNLLLPQSFLAMPFALAAGLLARYMRLCAAWLARIPLASVSMNRGFVILWLAGTILLFAAALGLGKGKKLFPQAACLSVIVLLFGILSFQLTEGNHVRVAVLDIGTDVTVVLSRGGHAAVVGCGGFNSGKAISYLNRENVSRLDSLEILTQDREEAADCADLAARFHPENLVAQQENGVDGFVRKAGLQSGKCTFYRAQAETCLWDGVRIDAVSCGKSEAARITADGVAVLICPAGTDPAPLPGDWRKPDFLVTDTAGGISGVQPVCTVFSMDTADLQKAAGAVGRQRSVWTGGYGNLVLEISGPRKLSIRRES